MPITARRFKLPIVDQGPFFRVMLVLSVVVSLLGGYWLSADPGSTLHGEFWTAAAMLGAFCSGAALLYALVSAIRERWSPTPQFIDVGLDGILVGARFIHYADIRSVVHGRHERAVLRGSEYDTSPVYEWRVGINVGNSPAEAPLLGVQNVELVTCRSQNDYEDSLGEQIARAIQDGLSAWRARKAGEDLGADFSRGERTGKEWLAALHRRGAGATASYRSAAGDADELARLLDDPQSKPSARAAAAVALRAAGDNAASAKLQIAAEAMVDPAARNALQNIADETAVAEALEALEELERRRWARRRPT